ncbi:MAG TPA: NAD-dependent epimerase/dehydratase family protein [Steroidobacteraceae bacterium]|nr:NAD-dependent epimerase/dehydratase family protein [Steroidobacteraceae bacterium]
MTTSRRHLLKLGAYFAASGVLPRALAAEAKPKTLLILGGTGFIGPHLTQEALRQGWKVTHFNRGKRTPGGVENVETLIGDRNGQIDALRGRKWDVVIDDTGQIPKYVKMSADLLAPNVGYCLYISSISAYASFAKPNDENSPTGKLSDPNIDKTTDETYGPMKALCEQYSAEAFKGRASIVRPGYIVGPLDGSDRFTYWPVRASKGGEMMAPGTPKDPIQIIDVRDLAAWMMKLAKERTTGYFNAISPPDAFTMGDIITASLKASPKAGTKAVWVPEGFLAKQWKPEELDLPPWSPMSGDTAGASLTSTARAQKAGLKIRPMQETVNDTLAWFQSLPAERQAKLRAGIDPQKEASLLSAWHASGKKPA